MINPLERLWKDRMDIYRFTSVVVNGITKKKEVLIQSDIKCKYSKNSLSAAGTETPLVINRYTLICGLDVDIKEGDRLELTQSNGKKIKLSVGEGFPYTYHQEFLVTREGFL